MDRLIDRNYILKNTDQKYLRSLGFHYDKQISDLDDTYFSNRFSVFKYKEQSVLDCVLSINTNSGELLINVYRSGTNAFYPPFYQAIYGNYQIVLDEICKVIIEKLRRIDAIIICK